MRGKLNFLSIALISLLLISFISAEETVLGTFERSSTINLIQGCEDSTYSNISKIIYTKTSQILLAGETAMTETSNDFYSYNFNDTTLLGLYQVYGHCDENGVQVQWWYDFEVTPSGQSGSSNTIFSMGILIFFYVISFIGFFGRNEIVTLIGGLGMFALSIYFISQGLVIYQDWITNAISYFTMALGAYFSFSAGYSLYEDM